MKFNIIIGAVLIAMIVAMFNIVNITTDNISKNKSGLTRLNKSFLSLSEEFQSVGRTADLIESTRESYRNSLVELSNRLDSMDETNSEIYRILNELDEKLNKPPIATVVIEKFIEPEQTEDIGVNGGLGVLTGTQIVGQPKTKELEVVPCPKPKATKSFDSYLSRITINRNISFTVIYDVISGQSTNTRYDGAVPSKLKRAVDKYISELEFPGEITVQGCTLPFTINI
jgi:hypothetical protein